MFATKQELHKNSYRSRLPLPTHETCDHQQNQKTKITDYQRIIPDRKLTVKRGVFPYAIHANPVSKREIFGKDRHVSDSNNKNNSYGFKKPGHTSRLSENKIPPKEKPIYKTEKPSKSTGFFGSNAEQKQTTPENSKNLRIDVTGSNSSTTTEMNKKVLLDMYLTEQYNEVLKAKATSNTAAEETKPKYINYTADETFQICTYKQIGEAVNQSFITESSKFKCSLEMTSSIQADLRKLHFERKNKEKRHSSRKARTELKIVADKCECTEKQTRPRENTPTTSPSKGLAENQTKEKTKFDVKDGNFRLKNQVLKTDRLSQWKGNSIRNQSYEGNDKIHRCRMPKQRQNDVRNNLTASSPPHKRNFISDFEMKKKESYLEKLSDGDKIYNPSPLFPIQQEFSPDQLKSDFKVVDSPTLFFSDTNDSMITPIPKVDKNNVQMPPQNKFSLDSAVFKKKFSPELINPLEIMNRRHGKSPEAKKKTTRRKIITPNPSYSDSTCHGVNPLKRFKTHDKSHAKRNKYLTAEKFNLF